MDVFGLDKAITDPNSRKLHDCRLNYNPSFHQVAQLGSDASYAKDLVFWPNHFGASHHVTANHELAEGRRPKRFKQLRVSGWRVLKRYLIPEKYIAGLGVVVRAV